MTFVLAQISDLHMGPVPVSGLRHWNAKRLLGLANWHRGRRRVHQRGVLDALVADLATQAPDHIAVTGDLINLGLPREYAAAQAWLAALGHPEQVTVIPGNHDIYTAIGPDPGVLRWSAFMSPNAAGRDLHEPAGGADADTHFPFVRRFCHVALICLNSAVQTPPFSAQGQLGTSQRRQLADLLERIGREGLIRVVLIHHPPLPGQARPRRALRDAADVADTLSKHGAELVLHGHNHRNMLAWQTNLTREHVTPVVGVASASLAHAHKGESLGRYNLFTFGAARGDAIEMVGRGFAEPGGAVVELERRLLSANTQDNRAAPSMA